MRFLAVSSEATDFLPMVQVKLELTSFRLGCSVLDKVSTTLARSNPTWSVFNISHTPLPASARLWQNFASQSFPIPNEWMRVSSLLLLLTNSMHSFAFYVSPSVSMKIIFLYPFPVNVARGSMPIAAFNGFSKSVPPISGEKLLILSVAYSRFSWL